jgi:hypothetical protein
LTPSGALSPLTPYTLTIGVGLRGSAGEQLAGPLTTSFTTGDRQWQTAGAIETGDVNIAENPQIAMNARGDAVAVWRRLDNQITRVWSNNYTAGGGWGTALPIGPDIGPSIQGPVRTPQVAMDGSGNAIAVWPQSDDGHYRIWATRYAAGSGWGTAVSLEPNAGATTSDVSANPQIKLDANGNAIAVWEHYDSVSSRIWSNRYTVAASGWGTARMIQSGDPVQAFNAQIAIDTAGNALVVWLRSDAAQRNEIWSVRYTAGGDWGIAGRISDNGSGAGSPQIAMDASGNVLAVWNQLDSGTSSSTRWNRYTVGAGWGTAATIEPGDGTRVGDARIACDANGNALAVWEHSIGMNSEVRSSRYTVGGGWAPAVNAGSTGAVLDPVVAIDSTGNALAVWQQIDSSNVSVLWANRFE